MSRPVTADLDRVLRGQAVPLETFLALLAEPRARDELVQLAEVRDLLEADDPVGGSPGLAVDWANLAAYAEGTLRDPARRQEVERFLAEQAPELLRQAEDTVTGADAAAATETWIAPPRRRPEAGS